MAKILDPYRPAKVEDRISVLSEKAKDHLPVAGFIGGSFFVALIGFFVSVFAGMVISIAGAPFEYGFFVGGGLAALVEVWGLSMMGVELRERLELKRLKALDYRVDVAPGVQETMRRLGKDLEAMDEASRIEFKHLWTNALEASEVLKVDPANRDAKDRIEKRRVAAAKIVKAQHELRVAKAMESRQAERDAAVSRFTSTDDSDLELADMYVVALTEGRRRFQEISAPQA